MTLISSKGQYLSLIYLQKSSQNENVRKMSQQLGQFSKSSFRLRYCFPNTLCICPTYLGYQVGIGMLLLFAGSSKKDLDKFCGTTFPTFFFFFFFPLTLPCSLPSYIYLPTYLPRGRKVVSSSSPWYLSFTSSSSIAAAAV